MIERDKISQNSQRGETPFTTKKLASIENVNVNISN